MSTLFAKNSFYLILSACAIFAGFALVQVHAGFEWIPPEEPKMQPEPQTMPVATPMPSLDELSPIGSLKESDKSMEGAQIKAAPESKIIVKEPVIKTHSFVQPEQPVTPPAPTAPEPRKNIEMQAEMVPAEIPSPVTSRVVVSQDAPQSAMQRIDAQQLTINPFPQPKQTPVVTPKSTASGAKAIPQNQEPRYDIAQGYEIVQGFGSELPLALALSQIVPAEYSYAFGPGVNASSRVSWNGNKSWPIVVEDMVRPLGLISHVQGQIIHIYKEAQNHISMIEPQAGSSKRVSVSDPGPIASEQPAHTLDKIQHVAKAQEPAAIPVERPVPREKNGLWSAKQGDSLKRTLDIWSTRANFDLVWDAQHDYQLMSDILVNGDFQSALVSMFSNAMDPVNLPNMTVVNSSQNEEKGQLIIQDKNPS